MKEVWELTCFALGFQFYNINRVDFNKFFGQFHLPRSILGFYLICNRKNSIPVEYFWKGFCEFFSFLFFGLWFSLGLDRVLLGQAIMRSYSEILWSLVYMQLLLSQHPFPPHCSLGCPRWAIAALFARFPGTVCLFVIILVVLAILAPLFSMEFWYRLIFAWFFVLWALLMIR